MQKQNFIGLMLASSLALSGLAGCQVPSAGMPGAKPAPGAQLAPAKQAAATENSQTTADAMSDEQEMEDYGYMADDAEAAPARFAVAMEGQPPAAEGEVAITAVGTKGDAKAGAMTRIAQKAPLTPERLQKVKAKLMEIKGKLADRKAKLKAKAKARLDKRQDVREKLNAAVKNAPWVDNGDGTKTKTFEFSSSKTANGGTHSRTAKVVRVVDTETGALISATSELSQTLPNGLSRTATRSKTLQEDGSYMVVFDSTHTGKDGRSRVAHWEKTISADGAVSGTGTITFKDKAGALVKTVDLKFGGTEEATAATATDPATATAAEVTATVEGTVTAEATDTATGTEAVVAVEASTEATTEAAPAAEATPTPAPEATATPAADATVEAGATATAS